MALEVGNVYARGKRGRLHLAVGRELLVYVVDSLVVEVIPSSKFKMVKSVQVEDLLAAWDTTTEVLNSITEKYLQPSSHIDRDKRMKKQAGTKKSHDDIQEQFLILRRHRIQP